MQIVGGYAVKWYFISVWFLNSVLITLVSKNDQNGRVVKGIKINYDVSDIPGYSFDQGK